MNLTTRKNNKLSAVLTAMMLAIVSPFAMAAGESTPILAVFNEYKIEVLILVVGFAVVLWTIRGAGLLKPKGG